MDRYATRHGFDGEEFDYLLQMVKAMDEAFIKFTNKKTEGGKPDGG